MKKLRIISLFLVLVMLLGSLVILPVAATGEQAPDVLGAQIRTEAFTDDEDKVHSQGLRFIGRISKNNDLTFGENANFGFLIIPASKLSGALTKDTPLVKTVKAQNLMLESAVTAAGITYDDNYYYFTVVMTGIPAEHYGTNLVVKAYLDTGAEDYTYSNSPLYEKRSIQYVAQAIADQGGDIPAFVTAVLEAYAEVGTDILVDADAFGILETYPAYPSSIDRDNLYTVTVTQGLTTKPLTVYNECAAYSLYSTETLARSLGVMDSNRRFCEFAFEFDAVTVDIHVNKKFSTYTVSPSSKFAAADISYDGNGTISVTVKKHDQFVVILDDDYKTALAVFPDGAEYDVPEKGASNVVYVEGNSQITLGSEGLVSYIGQNNEVMVVKKNYTKIYLAPGAILKKRIVVARENSENQGYGVKIYGRGAILDPFSDYTTSNPAQGAINFTDWIGGSSTKTYDAQKAVLNVYSYGFTIKDVKVLDGRDFNILFAQSSGSFANNVKILSTEMSTDGFMVSGDHTVKNSFVYCGDNALVMQKGTGTGSYYENILIGTTCAALYPQYECISTLKDIYVFRADDNLINVHQNNSGAMTMNVDGLDALDCVKTSKIFGDNGGTGEATKTFNLKNVVTRYTTGDYKSFTPGTYASQYDALQCSSEGYIINFTNLCVGGHRIGPDNDGSSIKVGSAYLGANTTGGTTQSGMTVNFAYDSTDMPAHTSVPAAKTANYTEGADYVAGPIRPWSRYTSYNCFGYIEGGQFKVKFNTDETISHRWGYTLDLTEQLKTTGAGTYTYKCTTDGVTTSCLLLKCANNSNSVTTVSSNKAGQFTVTASDLANYTFHVVVKSSSNSTGNFTLTEWKLTKK